MSSYQKWLRTYVSLYDANFQKDRVLCPFCAQPSVDFLLMGDPDTRVGFGLIWCNGCRKGARMCRIKAPKSIEMLTFDQSEELKRRVPELDMA